MNKIICEEIVGMFSSMQRRSPNATLLNIAAKCSKNKTIEHLMDMDKDNRNSTIKKSITIAASVKRRSKQYVAEMHTEIIKSVKAKFNLRDKRRRAQSEKKIRAAVAGDGDIIGALGCTKEQLHNRSFGPSSTVECWDITSFMCGIMKM